MLSFLKPRKTPSRAQDAASSPAPDVSHSARTTTPTRDGNDAKVQTTPISASKRGLWRHGTASKRKDDESSDARPCSTPNARSHSASNLLPQQYMTPPTRKPPETPKHLRESRPNSNQNMYPRSVPRSAGRSRDVASADTTAGDSVKIFVRVRPFNENEKQQQKGANSCLQIRSDCQISLMPHTDTSQYRVDKVFSGDTTQEDVFGDAGRAVVNSCLEGYNSCIFAYGQTGSGKTHTMLGALSTSADLSSSSGLIPRIFDHLLSQMQQRSSRNADDCEVKHECHVGMLEIYNETVSDLLVPDYTNLQIREDSAQGTYVENLSSHRVNAVTDVLTLLEQGTKNRHIGETRMNRESSRSHCVLIATIRTDSKTASGMRQIRTSRLNLVDLAGSEQQKASGASGERLKEASNINKSLSILGRVINSLAQQQRGRFTAGHIPYRDSKLTFLLQDSLGGNSKTVMIANISPSVINIAETVSTLRFAQRAKRMGNKAMVNEDTTGDAESLRRELARVKRQLANCTCTAPQRSAITLATPVRDSMRTPTLFGASQPSRMGASMTPGGGCASPHQVSVVEMTRAFERAQQAENKARALKDMCEALEHQNKTYQSEGMKRKMMDKFRDAENERLKKALSSGKVENAELLISDENSKLQAKNEVLQAQADSIKAELHSANARVQELRTRLQDAKNRRDPNREQLLEQVHNLQNLLLGMRAPGSGSDGTPVDGLLAGMDVGSDNAMAAGAEKMCLQKTKEAEAIQELKAKHEEKLAEMRRTFEAEKSALQLQLDHAQQQADHSERQRLDDSSRVHEELLEVRAELHKTRSEHESMYVNKLVPAQKQAAALRADADELRAQIADLEEQLSEATAQLKVETSNRVNAQHEVDRANEGLESYMSKYIQLKEEYDEKCEEYDDKCKKAAMLDEVRAEAKFLYARNDELTSRNVALENQVAEAAASMLRQSQALSLSSPTNTSGAQASGKVMDEELLQREHVIDVLRTEVRACNIRISELQTAAEEAKRDMTRKIDELLNEKYKAGMERDEYAKEATAWMMCHEELNNKYLAAQAELGRTESQLRTEKQSTNDLRAEVRRAAALAGRDSPLLPPVLGDPVDETFMLRDQLEHVTMDRDELVYERDQLKHEVAMLRETVTHNVEESAAAARASRSSLDSASKELPPADSMAGQFRAHTARIQELQSSIEELEVEKASFEQERGCLQEELDNERDKNAKQAIALRREIAAVQMNADEDKRRKIDKLAADFEQKIAGQDAELQEVRAALKDANKANAELRKQLQEGGGTLDAVKGGGSAEVARYLRNYTQLAASILQLAAWTCGESPATTQAAGGADENNSNSANRDFSQHILSPSLAAVALQKGPAGQQLEHLPWKRVADLVKDSGSSVPVATMAAGHEQLKTTVSDLLIWLSASNIDC